jgi:DHA1 family bicyclomycin/chloramphenicol resistance-like MFS transporter
VTFAGRAPNRAQAGTFTSVPELSTIAAPVERTRGRAKAQQKVIAPISPTKFVGVVAACMGLSALSIDLGLPAFADIRSEFGLAADSTQVSGLITMFFLGLAGGMLVFGPMSDRFGRKPILCVGFSIFAVGAIGATLMPTLGGVLAFRVLWGIGAAAPRAIALAMVRDTQQGNQMARTMSLAMAIYLIVPILAPSLGEALLVISPWRIVFIVPAIAAVGVMIWIVRRLPESLAVDKRRSVSPKSLLSAMGQVLSNRQTAALGLAVTFFFGAMTSFVGSSELIVDDVFGRPGMFALLFGIVGSVLGLGALLNARIVVKYGVSTMLRVGSIYVVVAAALMFAISRIGGGVPPLWLFWMSVALFMPGVSMLIPNCNTAAMVPLPHVAGMASAALGAASTAGGALLGSIADSAFDGTVGPFAIHALIYVVLGSLCINVLAGRLDAPAEAGLVAVD